ncbi:MAG: hypothetical protein ACRD16_05120 [Thermoanaerobaculia bacterium]
MSRPTCTVRKIPILILALGPLLLPPSIFGQTSDPPPPPAATDSTPSKQEPPSLEDLGFAPDQTRGNPEDQAKLDKRSHMLKTHQRLGLITAASFLATVLTSGLASGQHSSSSGRAIHGALGIVTAGLYSATAYYAEKAPTEPGTPTRGPIRFHKLLVWIHGPGMILTPILGVLAYEQHQRGEKVHGVAKAHSAVAAVTTAAYGLAMLSVSVKF